MNAATSQEVFAGPYLGDAATRKKFSDGFADMTNGFLAFPLCVPGTAVWKGRKGRLFILGVLAKGAAESKAKMKVGTATASWQQNINVQCTTDRGQHYRSRSYR